MYLRIHATVQRKETHLSPRLGTPDDSKLPGDFRAETIFNDKYSIEIVVWSILPLSSAELKEVEKWVVASLGFA